MTRAPAWPEPIAALAYVLAGDAIDTTTAGGKLVLHVFGAPTEFERGIVRERTRAGLDAAAARGRKGGTATGKPERDA